MVDPARRARLLRDLEQDFLPDYDAQSMPSADKRAAYALEHIASRVGRIEQTLAKIATALETVLAKLRRGQRRERRRSPWQQSRPARPNANRRGRFGRVTCRSGYSIGEAFAKTFSNGRYVSLARST
jgi:hypothetical protein